MTNPLTPSDALNFIADYCLRFLPQEQLVKYNDAYEVLRKLVVDDVARKKNAETIRIVRLEPKQ